MNLVNLARRRTKKIIMTDNFDRDNVADELVATNVPEAYCKYNVYCT